MNFVLDASLALAFVLESEATEATDALFDSFRTGTIAAAPALWKWELANALVQAVRRRRITEADLKDHLQSFATAPVEIDATATETAWNETIRLAQKHNLTCYDAAYLELAIRRSLALGSLDGPLRTAAAEEKVKTVP